MSRESVDDDDQFSPEWDDNDDDADEEHDGGDDGDDGDDDDDDFSVKTHCSCFCCP